MKVDDVTLHELRQLRGEKWATYGPDVLAAWVADMDFPAAEPIRAALREAVDRSDLGYPLDQTPADLPERFAERAAVRFAWKVHPTQVDLIAEVVQGLYAGLQQLTKPGEAAVVQTPIYPPFLHAFQDLGREAVVNQLVPGGDRFEIDFDALRRAIDARTRVFLLCNPHNPTGRAFRRDELERLAEIVLDRGLVVLADEIHAELVLDPPAHIPFASLGPEVEARTITFMSASKTFNIAGLRTAFAVFGSPDLRAAFERVPRHIRGGLNTLGLVATRVAFEQGDPWLREVLAYLRENRAFVTSFVRERMPAIWLPVPEATYLAWLDCRALALAPDPFTHFLERSRVALSDGRRFGAGGDGCVRLNFATPRPILAQILERLASSL